MASIIISTFRQPVWLEKVLWGYLCQQGAYLEVVVAEHDQDEATARVIDRMRRHVGPVESQIVHVRQEHRRRCPAWVRDRQ